MSTRILPRPTDQYPERAIVSTLTARIALVKGMHSQGSRNGQIGRCIQCGHEYPCPTLRALAGEYDA